MDILRLMFVMALLLFGADATDRAQQVIKADRASAYMPEALSGTDKIFLKQLAILASVQPASMVVQDGMLVGTGHDRVTETFDPTAHAETEAIRDACKQVKRIVLKNGVLYASRQPCAMCLKIIAQAGISRICIADSSTRVINLPVLSN